MTSTHLHGIISEEVINSENISRFAPLLFQLRRHGFIFGDENIVLIETGCTDNSCQLRETIVRIEDAGTARELKIGKGIEKITKMDVFLSMKKQFPEALNNKN